MFGITIRQYQPSDVEEIVTLFNNTVRSINQKDYTSQQINYLVQKNADYDIWNKKLLPNYTLVACKENKIIGFGSVSNSENLQYLYVEKSWINYGIGKMLLKDIIQHLTDTQQKKITVDASLTAKPFFEKMGFTTVNLKNTYIEGLLLSTYIMNYQIEQHNT